MDKVAQGMPGGEGIIQQLGAKITETSLLPTDLNKTYFFAYDTLLEQAQISRHVKKMIPFKVCKLPNHRLGWPFFYPPKNSALPTVVRTNQPNDEVWGMLYQATGVAFNKLDRHLKTPERYHKKDIQVVDRGGRRYHAFAYVLTHTSETDLEPAKGYLAHLIFLAQERGLPEAWIEKLRTIQTAEQ